MNRKKGILRYIAGLILTVIVVLFLHSETNLFDEHTDSCKSIDLCLILDKANLDNHHNFKNSIKIIHDTFQVCFDQIIFDYRHPELTRQQKPELTLVYPQNLIIENQILRI